MARRSIAAALIDSAVIAVVAYLAFRLGLSASRCSDLGDCPQLTLVIVLAVVVVVALYFGIAQLAWRRTLGQRMLNVTRVDDDV